MRIRLLCVGKVREAYLREGVSEYLKRLQNRRVSIVEVADSSVEKEAEKILGLVKEGEYVVALSESGKQYSSKELAELLKNLAGDVCFIVGGPNGLSVKVLDRADIVLSFSKMTFPHEVARLILLEQVYRAFMINEGRCYHR